MHEPVAARWKADQLSLQPLDGQAPYPYVNDELRKVARDAYVSWQGRQKENAQLKRAVATLTLENRS